MIINIIKHYLYSIKNSLLSSFHSATLLAIIFSLCLSLQAQEPEPFICQGDFYLSLSQNGANSRFYRVVIDPATGDVNFNQLPNNGNDIINSLGYRVTNNLIYGLNPSSHRLYIIDANGDTYFQTQLDLTQGGFFTAADIMPSGDTMVIVGAGGLNFSSNELVFVDLNDPAYSFESRPLVYPNGGNILTTDVAFDPLTGLLWGFDAYNDRVITIDPQTGAVDNTSFPSQSTAGAIGAMFFDPFGNLFGYGNPPGTDQATQLFRINKNTGNITLEAIGPVASSKDGCSCPYTVKMQKSVYPTVAFPCTEVTYSFEIANLSRVNQSGISFSDEMPANLTITEIIQNPFGGTLSGLGSNVLQISDMTIPPGIDHIVVKAFVAEGSAGLYKNQARLSGLPSFLGSVTVSDNPRTLVDNDSTCLEILPLFVDLDNDTISICEDSEVVLVAEELEDQDVAYQWSTGASSPSISINEEGLYSVTVSSGCETVFDSILVIEEALDIALGEDITIELGESISLSPTILFGIPVTFSWESNIPESLDCLNCPSITARPFFDATYTLTAQDAAGCEDQDSIHISVDKTRRLYIPNVFSPNLDGINDVFYINSKRDETLLSFRIFNRWGDMVFEKTAGTTNSAAFGWDGTFNGKALNPGVFIYTAELVYLDGITEILQGDVLLIR